MKPGRELFRLENIHWTFNDFFSPKRPTFFHSQIDWNAFQFRFTRTFDPDGDKTDDDDETPNCYNCYVILKNKNNIQIEII